MSTLDNTRIGEILAAQEARADGVKTPEEFQAALLEASRLCAAAYTLEVVTNAIAAEPDRSKRREVASKAMLHYIDFLAIVQPAFFRTPAEAEKTRKAIQMAFLDAHDISAKGPQP